MLSEELSTDMVSPPRRVYRVYHVYRLHRPAPSPQPPPSCHRAM
jgi:hypothetical protein